ncbi:MAG: hypothetical protein RLZZ500_2619 [Bacteroidota bacterium]|jgi:hypothetical protein
MRNLWFWGFILGCFCTLSAQTDSPYKNKKVAFSRDTIALHGSSIQKEFFKITTANGQELDTAFYRVDFAKAKLIFKNNFQTTDSLTVRYLQFPEFLTKSYSIYDPKRVVPNEAGVLVTLKNEERNRFKPFDGLTTSGSISRGVTIGNNQNTTVNSNLDLQITGKLSNKVSLRASIQDSNIPLQDGGYSQKLDEFDQIFVELFSDRWSIRAGDLFIENRHSKFLNFNKKVQGINTRFTFGSPENTTDVFAAAAVVRGQYARSTFTGQEGNQGPYKLRGNNGELYVLVISGSERVYVNGVLKTRGENNDYVIDYNAGEIRFTSLFPITSEMRIVVEYQYSERSYTRFVTYSGVNHQSKKWNIAGYVYSENDVKNQPLQQSLSQEQVATLQQAGDNTTLMNAPSAYPDTYSANKVLYKKVLIGTTEIFEYSNNPNDTLFNVTFTMVGSNLGNYVLANASAIGKIYQYVAPIAGVPQGNYEPITRLIAPIKLQIATLLGGYHPSEKTNFDFEVGISNNDLNLFSKVDDGNNQGVAAKFNGKQRLYSGKSNWNAFGTLQFIQQNFKTVERLFTIEFNRDWNLTTAITGNQSLITAGVEWEMKQKGSALYQFERLELGELFTGNRHIVKGIYSDGKITVQQNASTLQSSGSIAESRFSRNRTKVKYHFGKNWVGGAYNLEDNSETNRTTQVLSALSQRYHEMGVFTGRGDSTKVFVEMGWMHRKNDSLQNGWVQRVNTSNRWYVNSRLIQTEKANLSAFINYRRLTYADQSRPDEPSLNSRMVYTDRYWGQLVNVSTALETASGTIAQQEFTYLEVNPGQGVYMWNDYNGNGIQELQEFEIAPFPDLAKYVRVYLPNQIFVKTHQNKFSQSLALNPGVWLNEKGWKKFLSHFYNQTALTIDQKTKRMGDQFHLNPFNAGNAELLGLNESFRNSLFFNRGRQFHSVTYTYLNTKIRTLLSIGSQENRIRSHQIQYAHLWKKTWLVNVEATSGKNLGLSDNYASRNYDLDTYQVQPKLSYLFSANKSLSVFYEIKSKTNTINDKESLNQSRMGLSVNYIGEKKFTLTGEYSFYRNDFSGNAQSPVAFQMLEGLQPGKNGTWRILLQKNLTQYLDLNINYQGRQSETSKTIHTGSVQLRAFF